MAFRRRTWTPFDHKTRQFWPQSVVLERYRNGTFGIAIPDGVYTLEQLATLSMELSRITQEAVRGKNRSG
ncbi:MAG TPA: hypothetical protein VIY48_10500 [Candidatus Paceibacterota bacterium]